MPYQSLVRQIDRQFDALSPELQRAARWVREHPAELGLQSLRQSAKAAGVAPSTMTRLGQALDPDGFEGLRRPVRAHLAASAGRRSPLNPSPDSAADGAEAAPNRLLQAQAHNQLAVFGANPAERIRSAAQAVLDAREVAFLGLRASFGVAYHLHYTCDWLRPGTRLLADSAAAVSDRVADLTPADLLVVVGQAPYTRQTVELARAAHHNGVPLLALTDSPLSPLARLASQVLLFEADSPAFFHSLTGAQSLAEWLMDAVAQLGGGVAAARLQARQQRLESERAYWERRGKVPPLPAPQGSASV